MGGLAGHQVLLILIMYAYLAYCLQIIASKTQTENGWLAWIPIVNFFLMCKVANRPIWWALLIFIPFVNIFILIALWMAIAAARNKPVWLGIFIIIPLANLILSSYLAFSE